MNKKSPIADQVEFACVAGGACGESPSCRSVADARKKQNREGAVAARLDGGSGLFNKSGRRVSKTRFLFISARKIVTFIQVLRHIFPEFRSPHGFLRARACDTLGRFEQLEFKETSNLVTIYRNILESMADPELPVRVEAALALQPLIRHEVIRASMQQKIPQIMQQLLKL